MSVPLFVNSEEVRVFESGLATRALGKHIVFHARTQSTNDLALAAARGHGAHGTVFIADLQAAGRGRRGRSWDCRPGMGLLFSVLIRPERIPPQAAGWVPLAAGLACAEALAALSPALNPVTVKWPNDIVVPAPAPPGWRKLGGVLCESALPALCGAGFQPAIPPQTESPNPNCGYIVIGIGLNINQTSAILPDSDKAPPTSVRVESGRDADRKKILQSVLQRLEIQLEELSGSESRAALRARIEEKMREWLPPWKQIQFRNPPLGTGAENLHRGTFDGLDEFGRIRFCEASGIAAYSDAEIVDVQD